MSEFDCSWCTNTANHHDVICPACAALLRRWVEGVIELCMEEADE